MKFFIKELEKNNVECITEYNFYRLFDRPYSLGFTQPLPISIETDATAVPSFHDGLVMIFDDENTKDFIKSQILLNKDFMFTCKEPENLAPYLIKTDKCIIVTEEAFEAYLCSLDDSFDLSTSDYFIKEENKDDNECFSGKYNKLYSFYSNKLYIKTKEYLDHFITQKFWARF